MVLREADQPFRVGIEAVAVMSLLPLEFRHLVGREAHIFYRALPAGVPPSLEVFIDPLTFRSRHPQNRDDLPGTQSITMVVERDERVAADDGPAQPSVDQPAERSQQIRMVAERLRLAVLPGDERVQQEQRPARHFGASTSQKPLQILRAPTEDEFFMSDVVAPLPRLAEKPFRIGDGPVEKLRQGPCHHLIELIARRHDAIQADRLRGGTRRALLFGERAHHAFLEHCASKRGSVHWTNEARQPVDLSVVRGELPR